MCQTARFSLALHAPSVLLVFLLAVLCVCRVVVCGVVACCCLFVCDGAEREEDHCELTSSQRRRISTRRPRSARRVTRHVSERKEVCGRRGVCAISQRRDLCSLHSPLTLNSNVSCVRRRYSIATDRGSHTALLSPLLRTS